MATEKKVVKRKKVPKRLASITSDCTGCSGSPVCETYCPVEGCMNLVPAPGSVAFFMMTVDTQLCIGCGKCTSKGKDGSYLDGCPWDAIAMVDNPEFVGKGGGE